MANKLTIKQDSGRLSINYSWRTSAMWFLVLWCVVWDAGMLLAIVSGAGFFISLHLLAGIVVTYFTLTRFFNSTTITVDRSSLKITHGPMPWPFTKTRDIPANSLKQLYVDKSNVQQNKQPTYTLMALLDTGAEVKLVNAEPDISVVKDLERTIEGYLDIKNDNSLDLSSSGKTPKELANALEGITNARKAAEKRTWIPEFVKEQLRNQEEVLMQEMAATGKLNDPNPERPKDSSLPRWEDIPPDNDPIVLGTAPGKPRPLPKPDHDFDFPLYLQPEGTDFKVQDEAFRLGRTAQIDWEDDHSTTARQLELQPRSGGDRRYFFSQLERERWNYYEERRLDDSEAEAIGFSGNDHPLRFNNGDERYYPRDLQEGIRYMSSRGQNVQQYIYFTTSSTTQFRALKPQGHRWEVYVMEPFDAGFFSE